MKAACGHVFKYGDNVDTDVIIPARYLNSSDPKELATHCMEDIDKDFVNNVKAGDIMVANKNFGCGSSREHAIHAEDYRLRRSGQLYQSAIISKYNQKQEDCCINDQVCVTVFLYVARWL